MFNDKKFDREIEKYWNYFGLTEKDFICRDCGCLMLEFDTIKNIRLNSMDINRNYLDSHSVLNRHKKSRYIESDHNRWLVTGRTLSGKTFFRHLCWDCFFKRLPEIEDIPRRARKSSWYNDVYNGILRPPARCTSPSKYFKLLFDITDEELEVEHKKFDTASLESFIRRHGEKNGRQKYAIYQERQAYTNSKDYMIQEKGLTENDWLSYNHSKAATLENFIKRYGDKIGREKWNNYCELESYAGNKLEYFVEIYGDKLGLEKYLDVCNKKKVTIENFIKKYGKEQGEIKWKEHLDACQLGYSEISQSLFKDIDILYDISRLNSYYATKNREYYLNIPFNGSHKCFFVDYILFNKVIEFYGDYFHANPNIYSKNSDIHGKNANEIWEYDKQRVDAIKKSGYSVKIVWENDYRKDNKKVLNECIEFLKS